MKSEEEIPKAKRRAPVNVNNIKNRARNEFWQPLLNGFREQEFGETTTKQISHSAGLGVCSLVSQTETDSLPTPKSPNMAFKTNLKSWSHIINECRTIL
jgi:hypothetical protein